MTVLALHRHALGPRFYVLGRRVHHGSVGLTLIGVGITLRQPALVAAGALLVWHDRRDRREWLPRRDG